MKIEELNESSTERWAEKFDNFTPVKPDKELLEKFFVFAATELQCKVPTDEIRKMLENNEGGFASVIYKRVDSRHSYTISVTTAAFLGECVIKNFAESTMLANYLQYKAHKNGWKVVTMSEISKIFPNGFPSEEWYRDRWMDNKVEREEGWESDNLLDYPVFAKSIMNLE